VRAAKAPLVIIDHNLPENFFSLPLNWFQHSPPSRLIRGPFKLVGDMRTPAQLEASRRNGAQSRGPVTPAGKAASAQNAVTHGLYATNTVLASENQADFDDLRDSFLDRFCPADDVELELVDGMVKSRWLIRRLDRIMTTALDFEVDRCIPQVSREIENPDADAFQLRAHEVLTDNGRLEAWTRMQDRLDRRFDRHLRTLTRLQKQKNHENEPDNLRANWCQTPLTPISPQNKPSESATKHKLSDSPSGEEPANRCQTPLFPISAQPESQNQQNEPGDSQATDWSRRTSSQNAQNEPKLISINEAIRRGLIPSLSPRSASPTGPGKS
jgi:hypothetical protein